MSKNIEITYCAEWNYLPEADRVLAEIKDTLPRIDITKVASKGGVFDVFLGDDIIFSKGRLNRFPHPGECARRVAARLEK